MFEWLKTRECICMCWDAAGHVYGILARSGGPKEKIRIEAVSESLEDSLKANLIKVQKELNPENKFYIIAGGHLASEFVFETKIPRLDGENLHKAIEFELPREVPYPVEELKWSYIPYKNNNENGILNVRVWGVLKKEWDHIIGEISGSGVKIDGILSPFMCEFKNCSQPVVMETVDGGHAFYSIPGGTSEMLPLKSPDFEKLGFMNWVKENFEGIDRICENEKFIPVLAMVLDVMSAGFRENKKYMPKLPDEMLPQRFKEWKIACFSLASLIILTGLLLCGRMWHDASSRLAEIKKEKALIAQRISKIKKENLLNREMDATIKKISEASSGNAELLKCVHFLTEAIPDNMWVFELNSNNEKIELVVKTDTDAETDSINWSKSKILSFESVRKRRNSDGTTDVFLKLIYNNLKENKLTQSGKQSEKGIVQ